MELIYCAGGNRRFAEIAINAGFLYGSQLPHTVHFPLHFADQDWKKPNRQRYFEALANYKPQVATVLDWERGEQLDEVLGWAEEAASHVESVVIIPKVQGGVALIPRIVGNKPIRLGYSVPTKFGGTPLPYSDFIGWPVHLLGGSPHKQMHLAKYLTVASVDCNYHMMMAERHNEFWAEGKWRELSSLGHVDKDAPYKAFELSCKNIMTSWRKILEPKSRFFNGYLI